MTIAAGDSEAVKALSLAVDELVNLSNEMRDDVYQLITVLTHDPNRQMLRRSFVRACWAYAEGVTFAIKRFTFSACEHGGVTLSASDREFFEDKRLVIDEDGNAKTVPNATKTLDNVKRTLTISGELFGLDWRPDFNTEGWQQFRQALQLRHRITHPKSVAEVTVSPEDLVIQKNGAAWFIAAFNEFQDAMLKRYGAQANSQTPEAPL